MNILQLILIREKVIKSIRSFFDGQGFYEVITPVLNTALPLEPNIHAFSTIWDRPGKSQKLYLTTSPESALKKMLAEGIGNCYSIGHSFRNLEGSGPKHNPEFLMLEWYRSGADYKKIMEDVRELILHINSEFKDEISYQGESVSLSGKWPIVSLVDLFEKYADMDLEKILKFQFDSKSKQIKNVWIPDTSLPAVRQVRNDNVDIYQLAGKKGYKAEGSSWEQIFNQIFLNEIEPYLPERPIFITDFPARISPLCKARADKPFLAERFEFYLFGMELGNGNTEKTDSREVRRLFEEEKKERKKGGLSSPPIDEGFLKALEKMNKMGDFAGIGLGVERLAMIMADTENINF